MPDVDVMRNLTRHAKSNFIKKNLNEFKDDSKKIWKSLSHILPTKSNKNCNKIVLKNSQNNLITDDKIAANMMNEFYTSIGPSLAENMTDPWVYTGIVYDESINDIRTDHIEVMKLIKDIDVSKASAVPFLASKILKPAFIALADQLSFIFNLCFYYKCFSG